MKYRRKILSAFGANSTSQALSIAIQLLSVPIYLSQWSNEEYGRWILLTSVQSYLLLADAGILPILINRLTMAGKTCHPDERRRMIQTGVILITCAAATISTLASLVALVLYEKNIIDSEEAITATLMTVLVGVSFSSSLIDGAFRSIDKFTNGTYLLTAARLAEWIGGLVGLLMFSSFTAVAAGFVIGRLTANCVLAFVVSNKDLGISWGLKYADTALLRSMVSPGLHFLAFPLGNAMMLQGTTAALGYTSGTAAVATFNTCRTLSRTLVQAATLVQRSLWPEFSKAWGRNDYTGVISIYRIGQRATILFTIIGGLLVSFIGDSVVETWTHSKITVPEYLIPALILSAMINCAWQVPMVALTSANSHQRVSYQFLFSCAIPPIIVVMVDANLILTAAISIAPEILILISTRISFRKLISESVAKGAYQDQQR